MRIGIIAEKTGVSRDTVRLYENMGLLTGITQPYEYNNYKEYSEENIERIKIIRSMKNMGFSLKECKEVFTNIQEDNFDKEYQMKFLDSKINEVNKKIEELVALRDKLEGFRNYTCDKTEVVDKIKTKK
ncbi:MAG: MerR family transcriptional regulator [Bacteroidales bacterium]|nr:MerR family transcriptional regulator [Bacteroidales bacterium]